MNPENLLLYLKIVIEVACLWYVIYAVLLFIKGTRAAQLLKGIVILVVVFIASQQFGFTAISWVMTRLFTISIIALLIIFQPELRRGLARLGQFGVFHGDSETLDEVVEAAHLLSKRRMGALIAIEREVSLKSFIETSVKTDAAVNKELILAIFTTDSPIHDGSIILASGRIAAAACFLPLSEDTEAIHSLGTRHRAAMGLSQETDAVVVVVSEETGAISIAMGGKLTRELDREKLGKILKGIFARPRKGRRLTLDLRGLRLPKR